jgi:hypothetical protein
VVVVVVLKPREPEHGKPGFWSTSGIYLNLQQCACSRHQDERRDLRNRSNRWLLDKVLVSACEELNSTCEEDVLCLLFIAP